MAGPALGGFLIQLIGPARAVAADAGSFLISVVSLLWISRAEPTASPTGESGRRGFFVEMWEGIRVVFGNSTIWKIAGSTSTSNLGSNLFFAVFLIFAYRVLHLSPGTVGVVFAAGAVGGLLGAFMAAWIPRRIGLGPTLFVTILLGGLSLILVPLAQYGFAVPLLFASMFVGSFVNPVYNINQVSLRQAIVVRPKRFAAMMLGAGKMECIRRFEPKVRADSGGAQIYVF
jgi:Na+/melibiose symporter-like transporter